MGKFKCNKKIYIYITFILILIFGSGKILIEKSEKDIIIGFSAQLVGKQSELGVQERNGAQLAIEKINESGGIDGNKISLLIKDDKGTTEGARNGDRELIKEGVVAIIGHATTEQTLEGLNESNPAKVVMVGPTISSPILSGIDDYFIRIHPSFEKSSKSFADYIYNNRNIKNIAIIYDESNVSYSKLYCDNFSGEFKSSGGKISEVISYSTGDNPDVSNVISRLEQIRAEGLLIISSDIDTALIAQKIRLFNKSISLFSSSWAQTETLISNGGRAVEGMELEEAYDLNNSSKNFIDFKTRYYNRFGSESSFGAAYSYESTILLSEALKSTHGSKKGLKEAILKIGSFNGLTGDFILDKFGDSQRDVFLTSINNGKFVSVKKLDSTNSGGE